MDCDDGRRLIGLGGDAPTLDRNEDDVEGKWTAEAHNGVVSEAGGPVIPAPASRLHTGQNDLQDVSHMSTQDAWNSARQFKQLPECCLGEKNTDTDKLIVWKEIHPIGSICSTFFLGNLQW